MNVFLFNPANLSDVNQAFSKALRFFLIRTYLIQFGCLLTGALLYLYLQQNVVFPMAAIALGFAGAMVYMNSKMETVMGIVEYKFVVREYLLIPLVCIATLILTYLSLMLLSIALSFM